MLEVSMKDSEAVLRIARMIKSIGQKIELFNAYCDDTTRVEQTRGAAVDVITYILTFCSESIVFFIHNAGSSAPSDSNDKWRSLTQSYKSASTDIDDSFKRIEKLAQLAKLNTHANEFEALHRFLSSSPSSSIGAGSIHEQAKLPCSILPRTWIAPCWDRDSVIAAIEKHFTSEGNGHSLLSIALWGLGGVGKSHVALKYARAKDGEIDAIFWIHSQDGVAIAQSFSEIAVRLQLPGINPQNHEENRVEVLDWLQRTTCRWLLIFDNAEDEDLLLEYWPVASRGRILITTRSHSFAFRPADIGIEVPPFETAAGSSFLLHLLSLDIADNLSASETKSAFDLSQRLDGHALAIAQMAGLIYRRKWSIEEFIAIYDANTRRMHGEAKGNSLDTVWYLSFKSLDVECSAFLGVLSLISPDSIPIALFEPTNTTDLPRSLRVYQNQWQFSEIQEALLNLALIRRDTSSRTFSLHRLVQTQFLFFLNHEERQKNFNHVSMLVYKAFPQRDVKQSQYYDRWAVCRQYLQHILSLKEHYTKNLAGPEPLAPCAEFCGALVNCGRYMIETAYFSELEDVAGVAIQAFGALDPSQKRPVLHAYCFNLSGVMWAHRGQFQKAIGNLETALAVRKNQMAEDLDALSWAYTDLGNCTSSLNRHEEALALHETAEKLRIEDGRLSEATAVGNQNIGRTLYFLGRFAEAHDRLSQALVQLANSENWAMVAYTRFVVASVFRAEGKLMEARSEYIAAQESFLHGGKLQTHHFNAACMYKIGCVALQQGDRDEACSQLGKALVVAKLHSVVMVGAYARILYKLSEVIRFDPMRRFEADEKLDEAETILSTQRGILGYTDNMSGEEAYDSLVYVLWR
ncbi:hypothetical protein GGS24DRAFT_467087 [Hypoxylon argillaceum]|nr:hypothetical protein GGS24DRAFT_467087 [Hypoxylon argillaceum]